MDFFDPYLKDLGSLLTWLSKLETNITALQVIQGVAAILGIILSTVGIVKAWRYAERRLGQRLTEFLQQEEEKLGAARGAVRAIRDQRSISSSDRPQLFTNDELQHALRLIGKRRYAAAKATLDDTLVRTRERAELAHRKRELHERQRAVAHLLLGALADTQGDHQAALIHFQSVLEIDEEDVEAIEYIGFQYLRLANAAQALAAFQALERIAGQRQLRLLQSQAAFYCGLAHEKQPAPQHSLANIAYNRALASFPQAGPQLELARIYERKGLVARELGFYPLASKMLMHALARYAEHEHAHASGRKNTPPTGAERVIAALKALQQIADGNPGDDADHGTTDPNGDGAARSDQQQPSQHSPDGERPN